MKPLGEIDLLTRNKKTGTTQSVKFIVGENPMSLPLVVLEE